MRSDIMIFPMRYLEKDYQQTRECLHALETHGRIRYAERDGIGSMTRAWNTVIESMNEDLGYVDGIKYYWFPTNIIFDPSVPDRLAGSLDVSGGYAICPEYLSDHQHLRPDGSSEVREVPFIEFTAPMIRADVFSSFRLDEEYWYYWWDLIFSRELRRHGMKMYCDHAVKVEHVYLRNNQKKERVSQLREQVRNWRNSIEIPTLETKFGPEWKKELCITW